MRRIVVTTFLSIAIVLLVAVLHPSSQPTTSAATGPLQIYLELTSRAAPGKGFRMLDDGIPPAGSIWHELYPAFCADHTQTDYEDNGDGIVSVCDYILLDGTRWHIADVGPTYWTTRIPPNGGEPTTVVFEPTDPAPGSPVGQIWHEIHPSFCDQIHVDSFHDGDGNNELSVCDEIDVVTPEGTVFYHIDRIELDITIEPGPDVPAEPSTWGRIKALLNRLSR